VRRCRACHRNKAVGEYTPNRARPGGGVIIDYTCRECRRIAAAIRRRRAADQHAALEAALIAAVAAAKE
jgi:hypothetical protein